MLAVFLSVACICLGVAVVFLFEALVRLCGECIQTIVTAVINRGYLCTPRKQTRADGVVTWTLLNGWLHRDSREGYALDHPQIKAHYWLGQLHCDHDAAVWYADGRREYWHHGTRHRRDGPAYVRVLSEYCEAGHWAKRGEHCWWFNGRHLLADYLDVMVRRIQRSMRVHYCRQWSRRISLKVAVCDELKSLPSRTVFPGGREWFPGGSEFLELVCKHDSTR